MHHLTYARSNVRACMNHEQRTHASVSLDPATSVAQHPHTPPTASLLWHIQSSSLFFVKFVD